MFHDKDYVVHSDGELVRLIEVVTYLSPPLKRLWILVHPEDLRSRKCNCVKKEKTSRVQQPFQTVFYFGVLRTYYDIEHNN